MAKLIFIGSTCVDITVLTDGLPSKEEDVNAKAQKISVGGCAHNAAHAASLFHVPFTLASPVGTGIYGDYIRTALKQENIPVFVNVEEENGSCICIVDEEGNRSFISVQGAEYKFQKEWLEKLEVSEDSWVYACGLEIEQTTGHNILDYLDEMVGQFCYAPGPRLTCIPEEKMLRALRRANLIHLNAHEACALMKCDTREEAAEKLSRYNNGRVVITDGGNSVLVYDGECHYVDSVFSNVVDGTGAGDSHVGSILACLSMGSTLLEAVRRSNYVSSAVCEHVGACIHEEDVDWASMD